MQVRGAETVMIWGPDSTALTQWDGWLVVGAAVAGKLERGACLAVWPERERRELKGPYLETIGKQAI